MSGAEVVSLISGTVTIITAAIQVYDQVQSASSFPPIMGEVRVRLPILTDSLKKIEQFLTDEKATDAQLQPAKEVAAGCNTKAKKLGKIFDEVSAADDSSRLERFRKAVKALGKKSQVEVLAKGIAEDIRVLAENQAISRALPQEDLDRVNKAGEELSRDEPSVSDPESSSNEYNNLGTGTFNVNQGDGKFYASSGNATQNVYEGNAKAYNISGGNFGKGPWD